MSNPTLRPIPDGRHPYRVECLSDSQIIHDVYRTGDRAAIERCRARAESLDARRYAYAVSVKIDGVWVPVQADGMVAD